MTEQAGLQCPRGAVRRRPAIPAADPQERTGDGDPERERCAVRLSGQGRLRRQRQPVAARHRHRVPVLYRLVREEGRAATRCSTDLKGKKLPVGFTANSAQRRIVPRRACRRRAEGIDFDGVPVPHVVRGADDFMQGKVEATTFAVGGGKVAEADAKVGGIRFLNVPNTPEA